MRQQSPVACHRLGKTLNSVDIFVELECVRNRYSHSEYRRWLSRDPIANAELSQGANLYAYVLNNPENVVDESGLGGLGGAFGGITPTPPSPPSLPMKYGNAMPYTQECRCKSNGGKWVTYADLYFNGDVGKCADFLFQNSIPNNLSPMGTVIFNLGSWAAGPAVGTGATLGSAAQLAEARKLCTTSCCDGGSNPTC
jgi:RHS repeat-associated protein